MTFKVTTPNGSSDSVVFGSANTPTAAEVVGIDSGSSNGQLAFKTTASGTSTERMRINASGNVGIGTSSPAEQLHITGNFRIGSAVQSTPSGSAPLYSCRAWVNFNGTGTVAIRASGNVTSITDNGTGNYTLNFTTAMPDANYATISICGTAGVTQGLSVMQTITTTTAPIFTVNTGGTLTDYSAVTVGIFR